MWNQLKTSLLRLSKLGLFILLFVSTLSYFSSSHMGFELLSHFRAQYLFLSLALMLLLLAFKKFRLVALGVFVFGANAYDVASFFNRPTPEDEASKNSIKLVLSNIHTSNEKYSKVIDFVKSEQPDYFIALEINKNWLDELSSLKMLYPHTVSKTRNDNFGIAVYSKTPFDSAKVVYIGEAGVPSVRISSSVGGKAYTLIATHPLPPITPKYFEDRNRQLTALTDEINSIDTPKILIGDLNITMWSDDYQKLEKSTTMRNTRVGFGIMPTWPTSLPVLSIPIDHCLVSDEFQVISMSTGKDIGSDHLPIVVTLGL